MRRDPALWRDPLRFDPDRFRPELADGIDRQQYLPFGGGPLPSGPVPMRVRRRQP